MRAPQASQKLPTPTIPELRAGQSVKRDDFWAIRRRMILHHCKWDPQVCDGGTLEPFPLLLRKDVWQRLAIWAEALADETLAAERELLARPDLHQVLAVPRAIRAALKQFKNIDPASRVLRFDFHPTSDGWRISEVNSDVPGGYMEASSFTRLMAEHFDEARPAGDPAVQWTDAIAAVAGVGRTVALLSAAGFMEDQQITAFLAKLLRERGLKTYLAGPEQLRSHAGATHLDSPWYCGPVDAVVRFYQAEWLAALPRRLGWQKWLFNATPVLNSPTAILTESKRFPLVWSRLSTPLPTWQALLPETRRLSETSWRTDDSWVLKSAYCNTGDTVGSPLLRTASQWRGIRRSAFWSPGEWIAQRRFHATPISTPAGIRYPCVGVYTIGARAAGIYGRLAQGPLIDYRSTDVAVLVEQPKDQFTENLL